MHLGRAAQAFWRRRSRRTRARLVFYPSVVAITAGFVVYATSMPGASYRGPRAPLSAQDALRADELHRDVARLAATERNLDRPATLAAAADDVARTFADAGYAPVRQGYEVDGIHADNLEATLRGGARAGEIVIVGAHYDSVSGTRGADDNASGVAALYALARAFAKRSPRRSIRFVAFANEEPPYFWSPAMGSLVYAKACRAKGDHVVAMLSLETLGYYSDVADTQKYPPIVGWLYPDQGDFVAFVGDLGSRGLVRDAIGAFRAAAAFPSEGAALPSFVAGVGWSDHWSFWEAGYPAVMVTDTAPFRNPNYHQASDLPDTLDYDRLARVVAGLEAVITRLAN